MAAQIAQDHAGTGIGRATRTATGKDRSPNPKLDRSGRFSPSLYESVECGAHCARRSLDGSDREGPGMGLPEITAGDLAGWKPDREPILQPPDPHLGQWRRLGLDVRVGEQEASRGRDVACVVRPPALAMPCHVDGIEGSTLRLRPASVPPQSPPELPRLCPRNPKGRGMTSGRGDPDECHLLYYDRRGDRDDPNPPWDPVEHIGFAHNSGCEGGSWAWAAVRPAGPMGVRQVTWAQSGSSQGTGYPQPRTQSSPPDALKCDAASAWP